MAIEYVNNVAINPLLGYLLKSSIFRGNKYHLIRVLKKERFMGLGKILFVI